MIKKFKKFFKVVDIDLLVFVKSERSSNLINADLQIESIPTSGGKMKYFIRDGDVEIHKSILFPKVHVLSLIGKKGPAIGDCNTIMSHRGKSIYPSVVDYITNDQLSQGSSEIFILVNADNSSSIRGIEKAEFRKIASIKAKRFLYFYFEKNIIYH